MLLVLQGTLVVFLFSLLIIDNRCKKNCRFYKERVRPIIDTYKTAKIPSVTSRAVDVIKTVIISTALDVTGGIFAILYVSIMDLTRSL